ncbi:MAG: ribonuclease H-like domain-containing protein, partial [Treponema sp.]|nr:ribonuclease H-like domain-containing protein [Treponema sp.]
MPSNLRDRLRLIQGHKKAEPARHDSPRLSVFLDKGWASCGYLALKREVFLSAPVEIPARLPEALPILIPDLSRGAPPLPEDFLFFDLETTGLSGGAGTVAFLAAFGKIVSSGKLLVTQYLLLDYPGENDFLDAALGEFQNERAVITSYNGKCFDSPLLAARCLMNGKTPPEYRHADLLHPARRLWKTITNDCSQKSVEMNILKYDRGGDVPGALAPEIWFDFLRTGDAGRLFGICDHNVSDIAGLASILAAIIQIAADPFADKYPFDRGRLALRWRDYIRRVYAQRAPCPRPPEKLAE